VTRALDILPTLALPRPQVSDRIDGWLPARIVPVLAQHGIRTLADLNVRVPRRRRWWLAIPGLGMRSARHVEAFFAAHLQSTERARALVVTATPESVVPWENIRVPHDFHGSRGAFRAPKTMCALEANNNSFAPMCGPGVVSSGFWKAGTTSAACTAASCYCSPLEFEICMREIKAYRRGLSTVGQRRGRDR
jgi:hypothetical protein